MNIEIKKQISIFMENKPGNLAQICEILERNYINMIGITVADAVDHAVVRMVVDDPIKTIHIFGEIGSVVVESDVVIVQMDKSQPGSLKMISNALSENEINIDYIYGTEIEGKATIILKVSDPVKASKLKITDV